MKKNDYAIEIKRESNGYVTRTADGDVYIIQDDERDELKSHEELLWQIVEYFGFHGSKHDEERLRIIRERGASFYDGDDESNKEGNDGEEEDNET